MPNLLLQNKTQCKQETKAKRIFLSKAGLTSTSNFKYAFSILILIGVNFSSENSCKVKKYFRKFLTVVLNLISFYYLLLFVYHLFRHKYSYGELVMSCLQFLISTIMRLYFIFKKNEILESCKFLLRKRYLIHVPQKSLKAFSFSICLFVSIIIIAVSVLPHIVHDKQLERNIKYEYLYFGYAYLNIHLKIFGGFLTITRN